MFCRALRRPNFYDTLTEPMRDEILQLDIVDYQHTPPKVRAKVWWSQKQGVTFDNPLTAKSLIKEGIWGPGPRRVYPSDGRVFFDALPNRFKGLVRVSHPKEVDEQGGNQYDK